MAETVTKVKPVFKFRHAIYQGTHWTKGPWIVEGPNFHMSLRERTEAALLTQKLNEMAKVIK